MHLGDTLRSLALVASDLELKQSVRAEILDAMMDMHNDLNRWAVNTEHEGAADEVMGILDQYLAKVQLLGLQKAPQKS